MPDDKNTRVKEILSRRSPKHPLPETILDEWKLKGNELQFTDAGRRALAEPITKKILQSEGKEITMAEMDNQETVGNLCATVNNK